jgi:hypothetical protein
LQPHIQRWHTRYRLAGNCRDAIAFIESGIRKRVIDPYGAALERAFSEDPSVYVLRRVQAELTVPSPTVATEAEIARRWAGQIFAGVLRTITRYSDRSDFVMRFDDTSEYIACFLVDVFDDIAWQRWYYGAFNAYRRLDPPEIFRRILLDYSDQVPAIFRRLAALGRCREMLSRLSIESAGDIWRNAIRRSPEQSCEIFRIFVRTACELASALDLWITEAPREDEILLQYFRTSPPLPDWTQPRALAQAVQSVFQFLIASNWIEVQVPEALVRFDRDAASAVASAEWLDREWLVSTLRSVFLASRSSSRPIRIARASSLSPMQVTLLQALRQLVESGAVSLPHRNPQSCANALALFAALSVSNPALAAHSAAPHFIDWLLARWAESLNRLANHSLPELQLAAVIDDLIEISPNLIPRAQSASLPVPSQMPTRQQTIVTRPLLSAPAENVIESACAGLFLLSRAVMEARATQLATALGLPSDVILLAIAAEWTGCEPNTFDRGVLHWTGVASDEQPAARIAALDAQACEQFCATLERLLQDRASFAPSLAPVRAPGSTPLTAAATHLLRLWAHWLPGFALATPEFLLNRLIRRPGHLEAREAQISVHLQSAPLDVVLEMAGYLKPIASVPWLGDRRVTFTIEPSRLSAKK